MSLKLVSNEMSGQFDQEFRYAFARSTRLKPMSCENGRGSSQKLGFIEMKIIESHDAFAC